MLGFERKWPRIPNGSTISHAMAQPIPSAARPVRESLRSAIGDDEDSDDEGQAKPTPSQSSVQSEQNSRAASVSESTEDAVPTQLRGMSEKARGKLPAGQNSFSRHSSTASLNNLALSTIAPNGTFEPTIAWVSCPVSQEPCLH